MDINYINQLIRETLPESGNLAFACDIHQGTIYRISEEYADFDLAEKQKHAKQGIVSTEPWPFSDPAFGQTAPGATTYLPFRNPSGFVVGTPAAYCAAMIYRVTRRWPVAPKYPHFPYIGHYRVARDLWLDAPHPYDPKNWAAFLALNRFTRHATTPKNGHYYVGVRPQEGEEGLVVWFHRLTSSTAALVSTRIDREFTVLEGSTSNFSWVEIR